MEWSELYPLLDPEYRDRPPMERGFGLRAWGYGDPEDLWGGADDRWHLLSSCAELAEEDAAGRELASCRPTLWARMCDRCGKPPWPDGFRQVDDHLWVNDEGVRLEWDREFEIAVEVVTREKYMLMGGPRLHIWVVLMAPDGLDSAMDDVRRMQVSGDAIWVSRHGRVRHWRRDCHFFVAEGRREGTRASYPELATGSRAWLPECSACKPRREDQVDVCPSCFMALPATGVCDNCS